MWVNKIDNKRTINLHEPVGNLQVLTDTKLLEKSSYYFLVMYIKSASQKVKTDEIWHTCAICNLHSRVNHALMLHDRNTTGISGSLRSSPPQSQSTPTTLDTARSRTKWSLLIVIPTSTHTHTHTHTHRVKEAIHGRLHPKNINRDNGTKIPEAWMPTIKKHNCRRAVRQPTTKGNWSERCTNHNREIPSNHSWAQQRISDGYSFASSLEKD